MNEFIILLIRTIDIMAEVLILAITIDIILSWVSLGRQNIFTRVIHTITEPVLNPFRKMMRNSAIGGPGLRLDFSPVIAVIAISIGRDLITAVLISLI